jgi:hypothetical protein
VDAFFAIDIVFGILQSVTRKRGVSQRNRHGYNVPR